MTNPMTNFLDRYQKYSYWKYHKNDNSLCRQSKNSEFSFWPKNIRVELTKIASSMWRCVFNKSNLTSQPKYHIRNIKRKYKFFKSHFIIVYFFSPPYISTVRFFLIFSTIYLKVLALERFHIMTMTTFDRVPYTRMSVSIYLELFVQNVRTFNSFRTRNILYKWHVGAIMASKDSQCRVKLVLKLHRIIIYRTQ